MSKLKSCGKFCIKPKYRIVETWKLRKILQKTEKPNCRNLKVAKILKLKILKKVKIALKNWALKKKTIITTSFAVAQQRFGAIGVLGFIKVGFVLGSSVFNQYIWLIKSPTAPSRGTLAEMPEKIVKLKIILSFKRYFVN